MMTREELEEIIDTYKEDIENNNWQRVIEQEANKGKLYHLRDLVRILDECDIEYLPYLKKLPRLMYYERVDLTHLDIPEDVESIKDNVFTGCINLKHITLPKDLKELVFDVFSSSGLEEITIPANINTALMSTFHHCKSLKKVVIEDGFKELMSSTFYNCKSLTDVTIPYSVKQLGSDVFAGCENLSQIIFTGTKDQWKALPKAPQWRGTGSDKVSPLTIICADGQLNYK